MIQIFEVIGLTLILVAIVVMTMVGIYTHDSTMVGIRDYPEAKNKMLEWCKEHDGFYTKDLIQGQQCLFPPKEDRR